MIKSLLIAITHFFYQISSDYAIILLFMAITTKALTMPLEVKKKSTEMKKALLKPREKEIFEKYKDKTDTESINKRNIEITEMYKKEGVTLVGGCLPIFLRVPIIMLAYRIINNPLSYIFGFSQKTISDLTNIATATSGLDNVRPISLVSMIRDNFPVFTEMSEVANKLTSVNVLPNMMLFNTGIDLSVIPHFTPFARESIFPIIVLACTFILTLANTVMSSSNSKDSNFKSKKSQYLITCAAALVSSIMLMIFSVKLPCAVSLYWIYCSLLDVVQAFLSLLTAKFRNKKSANSRFAVFAK